MKIAYLDCASGISGDMTLGALVDAGADLAQIQCGIDSLGLPGCLLVAEETKRKGFRGLAITVEHEPERAHRHLHHIVKLIDGSCLSARQKDLAKRIFTRLGEAEAKVHGTTLEKVHFHEVGAADSIADVVGAAIGWDLLGVERIFASAIPTGRGTIEIAHGRCSLPAPATAELLKGIPLAASDVEAELTTPTGAAILTCLVESFGPPPAMTIERIGCGAGSRDLANQPNLLRLLVGTTADEPLGRDEVWQLETHLDDCSGELVGHATELLWQAGAWEVTLTPIQMKKNRPGVKLTVLCPTPLVTAVEAILFRETTTLGVRRWPVQRTIQERRTVSIATPWGPIEATLARGPDGREGVSPQYEAARRVSEARGVPLQEVYRSVLSGRRVEPENDER